MSTKVYPTTTPNPNQATSNPVASVLAILANMDASADVAFIKALASNPPAKITLERLVRRLGYTKASKQHRKAFIAGQANPPPDLAQFTKLRETQQEALQATLNDDQKTRVWKDDDDDDDARADTSRVKVVVPPGALAGHKVRVFFEDYEYEVAVPSGVVPGSHFIAVLPTALAMKQREMQDRLNAETAALTQFMVEMDDAKQLQQERDKLSIEQQQKAQRMLAQSMLKTQDADNAELHAKKVDQLHKESKENASCIKRQQSIQHKKAVQRVQERLHARTAVRHSKTLQKTTIFQHLSSDAISKIIDVMEFRSYDPGMKLVVQNDLGTEFMVLVKGAVNILKDHQVGGNTVTQVVNTLGGLDCLGEGALVHGDHHRVTTAVATASTQVLVLSYVRYQELLLDGTIAKSTHETLAKLSASYN